LHTFSFLVIGNSVSQPCTEEEIQGYSYVFSSSNISSCPDLFPYYQLLRLFSRPETRECRFQHLRWLDIQTRKAWATSLGIFTVCIEAQIRCPLQQIIYN
jgi:hypothetical protein